LIENPNAGRTIKLLRLVSMIFIFAGVCSMGFGFMVTWIPLTLVGHIGKSKRIGRASVLLAISGFIAFSAFKTSNETSMVFTMIYCWGLSVFMPILAIYYLKYLRLSLDISYTAKRYLIDIKKLGNISEYEIPQEFSGYADTVMEMYGKKSNAFFVAMVNSMKKAEDDKRTEEQSLKVRAQIIESHRIANERRIKEAELEQARIEAQRIEDEKKSRELELEKLQIAQTLQNAIDKESISNNGLSQTEQVRDIVDINTCGESELITLPGIGVVTAKKAISIRENQNGFESVDEFFDAIKLNDHYRSMIKNRIVCSEKKHTLKGRRVDY